MTMITQTACILYDSGSDKKQSRIHLDLDWATGARRFGPGAYVLDKLFDFKPHDDGTDMMWDDAMTTLAALLDYVGHTYEEALELHGTLKRRHDFNLDRPGSYGIDSIKQFWEDVTDLDQQTPVRISVVEHY